VYFDDGGYAERF